MPVPTFATLPIPILLQIIQYTFPARRAPIPAYQTLILDLDETDYTYVPEIHRGSDAIASRHRRTLVWLSASLRLACRAMYFACMHTLRATCIPAYQERVRPLYSTEAYSVTSMPHFLPDSPLHGSQRETAVLDRFVLLKLRADVLADESELHLGGEDTFRDLFDVAQPRARLEDLVCAMGVPLGIILSADPHLPGSSIPGRRAVLGENSGSSASLDLLKEVDAQLEARSAALEGATSLPKKKRGFFSFKKSSGTSASPACVPTLSPLPFCALSVSFQPRRVGLVVSRTRTIAEVQRTPGKRETLEVLATHLVEELIQLVYG